jgi:MFS family permease
MFYKAGLILRTVQGQGDILLQFTAYAIITSVFSDNIIKYIGYVEIIAGVGLSIGPLLGGFIYKDLDYQGTMFFFGTLNLFVLILC